MGGLSDSEDELNIRNTVALQQKKMSDALNCSLTKFSRLYNVTSHNNPPVPTNEVDPELAAINADSKRCLDSRSTNSVTKIIRNSNSPKKNVSANRFAELSNTVLKFPSTLFRIELFKTTKEGTVELFQQIQISTQYQSKLHRGQTSLQFCSRDAVTWLKAKSFFCFLSASLDESI